MSTISMICSSCADLMPLLFYQERLLLFERGIGALSGTGSTDPRRVLRSILQGATFRQIKRKGGLRLLTRLGSKAQDFRGMDEVQWKRHE